MNLTESDQKLAQMIPNYVQIDMAIVSINTGNYTISLNKHTIGGKIYFSTHQYTLRPMCILVIFKLKYLVSFGKFKLKPMFGKNSGYCRNSGVFLLSDDLSEKCI